MTPPNETYPNPETDDIEQMMADYAHLQEVFNGGPFPGNYYKRAYEELRRRRERIEFLEKQISKNSSFVDVPGAQNDR